MMASVTQAMGESDIQRNIYKWAWGKKIRLDNRQQRNTNL